MNDPKRPETKLEKSNERRGANIARLSVTLPRKTLVQLKIHAAQHETTIRDIVTNLIIKQIEKAGADT